VIPRASITEWGRLAPWPTVDQIEQDLVLSRVIVEIANDDYLGEELMFRGYAFQLLAVKLGKLATMLPMAIIFGAAHIDNLSSTPLSVINTVAWGLLLGYATLKSRGLWLPIGLHYGWNWTLPMLGANLSGFKMGVTGLRLGAAENLVGGGAYGPEASLVLTLLLPGLFYLVHSITVAPQQALLLRGLDDD